MLRPLILLIVNRAGFDSESFGSVPDLYSSIFENPSPSRSSFASSELGFKPYWFSQSSGIPSLSLSA